MKRPPESFFSDYAAFSERMEWARLWSAEEDISQGQLVYADMRDFLDRWQGKTGVAEIEATLARLRPLVEHIERVLESKYLEALCDLVERRHTMLIAPSIFKTGVVMLGFIKNAPDSLRPELQKIFRESLGYDFDAERYYRENEGDLDVYPTEYNHALAKMEVTWPDHFTAETRTRLERAEIEEINAWRAELDAQLQASIRAINKKVLT